MITIHHINCGTLIVPGYPTVVCHCLLLEDEAGLTLVDTGIGLKDVQNPIGRFGKELIDAAGFQFHEADTAVRRIQALGLRPEDVRQIILTHGDPDHAGGLADFPDADVHLSDEELREITGGRQRYLPVQFEHRPKWRPHSGSPRGWFGLDARPVVSRGDDDDVLLIPLFGHTLGHCGVAIRQDDRWLLHAGDAYYLRAELTDDNHPVTALATARAENDEHRRASLDALRRLLQDHEGEIDVVGYHDITELPDPQKIGGAR
jgi:glyoxylase-like metal-dependent hydrolase (beta-lactamase superfamily II)